MNGVSFNQWSMERSNEEIRFGITKFLYLSHTGNSLIENSLNLKISKSFQICSYYPEFVRTGVIYMYFPLYVIKYMLSGVSYKRGFTVFN